MYKVRVWYMLGKCSIRELNFQPSSHPLRGESKEGREIGQLFPRRLKLKLRNKDGHYTLETRYIYICLLPVMINFQKGKCSLCNSESLRERSGLLERSRTDTTITVVRKSTFWFLLCDKAAIWFTENYVIPMVPNCFSCRRGTRKRCLKIPSYLYLVLKHYKDLTTPHSQHLGKHFAFFFKAMFV